MSFQSVSVTNSYFRKMTAVRVGSLELRRGEGRRGSLTLSDKPLYRELNCLLKVEDY